MENILQDEYENCSLTVDIQKQILDNTINSDLIERYPLKVSYQRAFLKLLMEKVHVNLNILLILNTKTKEYKICFFFYITAGSYR